MMQLEYSTNKEIKKVITIKPGDYFFQMEDFEYRMRFTKVTVTEQYYKWITVYNDESGFSIYCSLENEDLDLNYYCRKFFTKEGGTKITEKQFKKYFETAKQLLSILTI